MADTPAGNGAEANTAPSLNALAQYAKDFDVITKLLTPANALVAL